MEIAKERSPTAPERDKRSRRAFLGGKLSEMAAEEVIRRQHRRLAAPLAHIVGDESLRDVMNR